MINIASGGTKSKMNHKLCLVVVQRRAVPDDKQSRNIQNSETTEDKTRTSQQHPR